MMAWFFMVRFVGRISWVMTLLMKLLILGRRRVSPAVIDARRNLSGVCGRWYPVILDLHRFFVAISRTVVNHDGHSGTAPDPLVWSAGALHKRRRLVHAVRDRAFFAWASWYLVL